MSNSRLCEQIHGMMRFGLRSAIGMDQADHHRMYNTGTNYGMNEERRRMLSDSDAYRKKNKTAAKHSATKSQQQRLSGQLVEMSAKYVNVALSVIGAGNIPGIKQINEKGRRQQDNNNLRKQIEDEDAKASRLTRQRMTADTIKELANKTKPTNDCTFVGDALIIGWREKVAQMIVQKYWHSLNSTQEKAMDTFNIARKSFIFIDDVLQPKEFQGLVSYNKAKEPIHKYIKVAKTLTEKVFEYVKDLGGFDNKSVEKNDILFLFIRPIDDEFDEEAIEPAEEALVNTCKRVDNHYTYTAQKTEGPDSNDDIDSGDNAMEIDEYTLDNGDVGC